MIFSILALTIFGGAPGAALMKSAEKDSFRNLFNMMLFILDEWIFIDHSLLMELNVKRPAKNPASN